MKKDHELEEKKQQEQNDPAQPSLSTLLVQAGIHRSGFDETAEALYLTSGFVYQTAEEAAHAFQNDGARFVYSRFANPTVTMCQDRVAALEFACTQATAPDSLQKQPFCRVVASGMAAVSAAMLCMLKTGDRVVASRALFGSCFWVVTQLLPQFGIDVILVDGSDHAAWQDALSQPTQMVFFESPSNPLLDLIDMHFVIDLAHQAGARVLVDNVFATPILQSPFAFGADIVIYSATKHMDGQGRALGGVILARQEDEEYCALLANYLRQTGPSISPFNAWIILKSLETLQLRVEQASHNARHLAFEIAQIPGMTDLRYPHHPDHPHYALAKKQMRLGSTLLSVCLPGGRETAFRFLNRLKLIKISNNLGDSKSLATHPSSTTHSKLTEQQRAEIGLKEGHIRLSVGLEDTRDLIQDIRQAYDL